MTGNAHWCQQVPSPAGDSNNGNINSDRESEVPDVTLTDEDTSVVDRLGEATFEDEGLETTLHEVLETEGENVIETLQGGHRDQYGQNRGILDRKGHCCIVTLDSKVVSQKDNNSAEVDERFWVMPP